MAAFTEMYLGTCTMHMVYTWGALQGHKMRRLEAVRLGLDGHRELHCSRAALTSTASAQKEDNNNHDVDRYGMIKF